MSSPRCSPCLHVCTTLSCRIHQSPLSTHMWIDQGSTLHVLSQADATLLEDTGFLLQAMKQQVSKPEGVETGFWSLPHPPPKTASGFKTKHLEERSLLSKPTAPAPSWCVCGGDGRGKSSQSSPTCQQESRPRATVCSGEGAGQQGIYARGHRSNRNAGLPPSPLIPSHPLSSPPPTSPLLPSHLIPSDAILSLHLDHHP